MSTDPDAKTDWKSDLRQRGYRLTPQRQLVLEAVDALEHATPDDILCEVRKTASGINISTVYRTLELLEELGLVSHAHLGHGAPTYHLADRHHHIHLVCRDCTGVIEADLSVAADFTEKLRGMFGFDTDMKHFAIFGRCGKCASGEGPDTAGDGDVDGDGDGSGGQDGRGPGAGPGDRAAGAGQK
ncbi:Fur family transcriptional regulator [Streptomyces sp. CC224B]|uniref:Fur family transcriptional regulator n=1 Tax=Streptomyces sp. CC224B TaxID=3044571 RepID=UPI0024A9BC7A|nr:Fur family transcriptional regulator [Streptomyces sp. CC224B]